MSGKTIESFQIRVYMNARELGLTQVDSATIAEFSERTGQRIEAGTHQPKRGQERPRRTGHDPLAEVWESELKPMLEREPGLTPMTLFEYLQERYPGQYPQVLRTLQRRVQEWKALHGEARDVMFELRHEPGMMGFSDFTELTGVEVTINGHPFEHLIYHYRLAYSGWQYAQIIQGGESFVALSEGLQNALFTCGGVPKQHRTDSLSAAYRNLGGQKKPALTTLYDQLCDHYRLQPTRNNRGIAHENGSIESPHGHLKHRIKQAILLRGSSDFASIEDYQALIDKAVAGLNRRSQAKYEEEKQVLQALPQYRVADYEVVSARVSCHSTIEVRCMLYTVPSRLIGRTLEL
ncbi:IS21 family transposase, partial [Leptolyngbya sp. FACHB-16]|uniref:IS21 family transposase n=2 Tax=Leptolyngbya TaxID=47251 RepID=UPI001685C4BB